MTWDADRPVAATSFAVALGDIISFGEYTNEQYRVTQVSSDDAGVVSAFQFEPITDAPKIPRAILEWQTGKPYSEYEKELAELKRSHYSRK